MPILALCQISAGALHTWKAVKLDIAYDANYHPCHICFISGVLTRLGMFHTSVFDLGILNYA